MTLLGPGCGGPTESDRDNRRVLEQILTAITLDNPRLLEDSAQRAAARHDAAQLADDDYRAMEAIVDKARRGNWREAEADAYVYRKRHPFVPSGH
jgi:hypothetical protein